MDTITYTDHDVRNKEGGESLQEHGNYFLSLENALFAIDPVLAKRLRNYTSASMAKRLNDLEKSRQELAKSLKDLEKFRQEQVDIAKNAKNERVITRIEKLDGMIEKTQRSLELNLKTRDELMEWLLGSPLPAHFTG